MKAFLLLALVLTSSLAFGETLTYKIDAKAPHRATGLKIVKGWQHHVVFEKQPVSKVVLPSKWDWRTNPNGLTAVQNQGNCGSCWAFSLSASFGDVLQIAGVAKKHRVAVDLSEQYLLSCNTKGYNCEQGGFFDAQDMFVSPGAVVEKDFPYTATTGKCKTGLVYPHKEKSWTYVGTSNPDATDYTVPTTEELKTALYIHGPLSVAVNATNAMMYYMGGTFNSCTATTANDINHAVNLVGWDDSKGAWIMRNSWGTSWGEKGYGYVKYGCNMLGFAANYATYEKPVK